MNSGDHHMGGMSSEQVGTVGVDMDVDSEQVEKMLPLVFHIAKRLVEKQDGLELGDLITAGYLGLYRASETFDDSKSSFSLYAGFKIQAAMLEEIRSWDHSVSRYQQRVGKNVYRLKSCLEKHLGHSVSDNDMIEYFGIDPDEYEKLRMLVQVPVVYRIREFDDEEDDPDGSTPCISDSRMSDTTTVNSNMVSGVRSLMECLPDIQALVLTAYFHHDLQMKEISTMLGVTESRVQQIHAEGLRTLKYFLTC